MESSECNNEYMSIVKAGNEDGEIKIVGRKIEPDDVNNT